MAESNALRDQKLTKLGEIRRSGVNPYPYRFNATHHSKDLAEKYSKLRAEESAKGTVSVAGRIMQLRRMGKVTFAHLMDQSGRIQLYFKGDAIEGYDFLKKIDIGDFLGVMGTIFKTKTGELTVSVNSFELLAKSIQPLPEKYHGLKDEELRYRRRYLDLLMNPEVREIFVKRSAVLRLVREFYHKEGFVEVETPCLQLNYGGANAKPFTTHINAWDIDLYLSISPELQLKRLLVGGFERVFTIAKAFRNEGVDRMHNPEFTLLESYQAFADYTDVMRMTEELFAYVAKQMNGTTKVMCAGAEIDLKPPWRRVTMLDVIKEASGLDAASMDDSSLFKVVADHGWKYEGSITRDAAIELIFEELCEKSLIQPTFVIDYPKESTPLCKEHRKDKRLIERFEVFIAGSEFGNAYSEQNDPLIQRELLKKQESARSADQPMDEDFIFALEVGMPPAGGLGIGIDRMVMLLTGAHSVREVILFPTMRPAEDQNT